MTAPIPDFLRKQYLDETKRMQVERAKLDGNTIQNPTDQGGKLEVIIREFLERHLPGRFGVATGYLINPDGDVSDQLDAIIYDKLEASDFAATGEASVLPIDAVYATIEVKATARKTSIDKALKNAESVRKLDRTIVKIEKATGQVVDLIPAGPRIYTALFAFETETQPATVVQNLSGPSSSLDHVCLLGKGNVVWAKKEEYSGAQPTGQSEGRWFQFRSGPKSDEGGDQLVLLTPKSEEYIGMPLLFFLFELRGFLQEQVQTRGPVSLIDYAGWARSCMQARWENR